MDKGPATGAPGYHQGDRQASVSSFITSLVLLVGVFGGLVIVVTVILVCKYCQGRKKPERGDSGRDNLSERTLRALQRYETINSDIFSDPSTCSFDGVPLTPRKTVDFRLPERSCDPEKATETTHLTQDLEQDDYGVHEDAHIQVVNETETAAAGSGSSPPKGGQNGVSAGGGAGVGGGGSRRVSFQLERLPRSSSTVEIKLRRYIEGDFHHLKHSKIGRPLPRQFSVGGAIPGRVLLDDPQYRFSSLDERMSSLFPSVMGHDAQRSYRDLHQFRDVHQSAQTQQMQQQQQHQITSRKTSVERDNSRKTSVERENSRRTSVERENSRQRSTDRENSPKHNKDVFLSQEQLKPGRDRRESPSPTFRPPRGLKNSPSPTFKFVKETSKNSPSPPFRPISDGSPNCSSLSLRDSSVKGSPPSPFRPISDPIAVGNSPSPTHKPVRTQVSVEVHHQQHVQQACGGHAPEEQHQLLSGRLERTRSHTDSYTAPKSAAVSRAKAQHKTVYSHSLESANPSRQNYYRHSRKVKSHGDDLDDYDVLKITEFSKGPFYNADYDVIAELGSPGSKVRYNDTGSLEQLNEGEYGAGPDPDDLTMVEDKKDQDHSEGTEDSAETINGNRKYRALWRLRATLEEEEECSDTVRMEDMTSPDDSPDREHVTPNTTSFESNAQSDPCPSDHRDSGIQFESTTSSSRPGNHANFLHPNYENRRQNYRNVLNNRFQRNNQSTSVENSFDSVETDGDVSDTSRYEVTTTSFESSTTTTTENTDSTTESQASKLRQMKADSGYKSLETQQQNSKEFGEHETAKWDMRMSVDCCEGISARRDSKASVDNIVGFAIRRSSKAEVERLEGICHACGNNGASGVEPTVSMFHRDRRNSGTVANAKSEGVTKSSPVSYFDRRNGKTASKKRREYSRERQTVQVYESINEPETDSRSDLHSGDSFEDSSIPNKISVFARFFKSHSRGHRTRYLVRDYSIDEKTNSIFNEFVKQEVTPTTREATGSGRLGIRRSPRLHRHRLQRKHTEPALLSEDQLKRRDRLAPSMRSASLGSDSSASSARRISPQDSIEEEEDELEEETLHFKRVAAWSYPRVKSQVTFVQRQLQSLAMHERAIPIIKLPEEDIHEASSVH